MRIELIEVTSYGTHRLYAADERIGEALSALTGQRTVSHHHIPALRLLGFEVSITESTRRPAWTANLPMARR